MIFSDSKKQCIILKTFLSMNKFILLLLSWVFLISCKTQNIAEKTQKTEKNYVLLISFDGFRYDYPDKFNLKNFQELKQKSSYAKEGTLSTFPSKTFPNHYSIVTGMYAGNHGIVDNKFYAPSEQKIYSIPDRSAVQNANFYGGVPLWQWLQKHGIKTASYFWVGSEAPILGEYPTYYKQYDSKISYDERINQVFDWFALPEEERPQFITLYFEFVDYAGHQTGTNSEETKKATELADELLGKIRKKIQKSGLPITTIITSDHGMIDMKSDDKLIITGDIEQKLSPKADIINNGMHSQVYLKNQNDKEEVYQELKKYFADKPFAKVYKKEETPLNWHYRKHPNIGDLVIITDAPYYMITDKENYWAKKTGTWGTHGYDPHTTPEMRAIFYAFGNKIKENYEIPTFENVHIFPFITQIFGIGNPAQIDGKTEILSPIIDK